MSLAVAGLGGGLAIAFLSFNSSESSPRIAGVPREIIYVPPADSTSPDNSSAAGVMDAAPQRRSATDPTGSSLGALQAFAGADTFLPAETSNLANAEPLSNNFDTSPAGSFTALDALASASTTDLFAANAAAANEIAFSGVAAPVPEPSTWAMIVSGTGLLSAALRRRKRG